MRPNSKPPDLSRLDRLAILLFAGMCLAALSSAGMANAEPGKQTPATMRTLTTSQEVHRLTSEEAARAHPVHLRGVVTYYDPSFFADGYAPMFIHDAAGCIFVRVAQGTYQSLTAGSLIDLRGVSGRGDFAPIVVELSIQVLGRPGLPPNPRKPSLVRLLSGVEDGQWVQVEGVVHSVVSHNRHINLQLVMADGPITILMGDDSLAAYAALVDAKVRIRGNAGPLMDSSRTQMIGAKIDSPGQAAVEILEPAPADPFKLPVVSIDRLLRWDMAPQLTHRVHVRGRVTLQWPGTSVCIRDATQGICAQAEQSTHVANGERIDIAGFAKAEAGTPVLTDATFSAAGPATAAPLAAVPVTAEQALLGGHQSDLIQIEGQLLSRDLASADTTLLLSAGRYIFKAILPKEFRTAASGAWENGSILRVTGICSVQLDALRSMSGAGTAVPTTFQVLMRSPADVTIVRKPSWWTASHMVVLLALALAGTLAVLGWVVALRRRIRESEERFRHMAQHDALTGLATRLVLQDRLKITLETAKRHGTGVALLMLDLDKFKDINDTFGHGAGDKVLMVTASRLLDTVRKSDTVARIGGDEFVVLLTEFDNREALETIAGKLVTTLSEPIPFEGYLVPVTVSVGVCALSSEELDEEQILKDADAALYAAKERGRNCFAVYVRDTTGNR